DVIRQALVAGAPARAVRVVGAADGAGAGDQASAVRRVTARPSFLEQQFLGKSFADMSRTKIGEVVVPARESRNLTRAWRNEVLPRGRSRGREFHTIQCWITLRRPCRS